MLAFNYSDFFVWLSQDVPFFPKTLEGYKDYLNFIRLDAELRSANQRLEQYRKTISHSDEPSLSQLCDDLAAVIEKRGRGDRLR